MQRNLHSSLQGKAASPEHKIIPTNTDSNVVAGCIELEANQACDTNNLTDSFVACILLFALRTKKTRLLVQMLLPLTLKCLDQILIQ